MDVGESQYQCKRMKVNLMMVDAPAAMGKNAIAAEDLGLGLAVEGTL